MHLNCHGSTGVDTALAGSSAWVGVATDVIASNTVDRVVALRLTNTGRSVIWCQLRVTFHLKDSEENRMET